MSDLIVVVWIDQVQVRLGEVWLDFADESPGRLPAVVPLPAAPAAVVAAVRHPPRYEPAGALPPAAQA